MTASPEITPSGTRLVARQMLDELDRLMSDVTGRVWQQVPAYPDVLVRIDDLESQVQTNLRIILQSFCEDRAVTAEELQGAKDNGELRALQGVGQSAIIQSFRNAERSVSRTFLNGCTRLSIDAREALDGQQRLIARLDEIELVMLNSFRAMQEQIATREVLSEPDLIRRLVLGETIARGEMTHLANVMRLPDAEASPFIGAAVTIVDDDPERPHELTRLRHRLVGGLQQATGQPVLSSTVTTDSGLRTAVLTLPWFQRQADLATLIDQIIAVDRQSMTIVSAVGDSYIGLARAGGTCSEALSALEVGVHSPAASATMLYADVLLEVLVMAAPDLIRKIYDHSLGKLHRQSYLQDTVQALVDTNMSLSAAARALHVHKNTVTYRIRRIDELCQLDMNRPQDLARIVLGLEGERLGLINPDDRP